MELTCEVTFESLEFAVLGKPKMKPINSELSIGTINPEEHVPFLHISYIDNSGEKLFKIYDNVEHIFAINLIEGEFSIRFKQPRKDLIIKTEEVTAGKHFLKSVLKLRKNGNDVPLKLLSIPNMLEFTLPGRILNISSLAEYNTASLVTSLKRLTINNIGVNFFYKELFSLKNLSHLQMEGNEIDFIPKELGLLTGLRKLYLSSNKIKYVPEEVIDKLKDSLTLLDLCHNLIEDLPLNIVDMNRLCKLYLSFNKLQHLPALFGKLKSLRFLSIDNNELRFLPNTFGNLYLELISMHDNLYSRKVKEVRDNVSGQVMTLKEICALKLRNLYPGKNYSTAELPQSLCNYMKSYLRCFCLHVSFTYNILVLFPVDVNNFARFIAVKYVPARDYLDIPIMIGFCSSKCLQKSLRCRIERSEVHSGLFPAGWRFL